MLTSRLFQRAGATGAAFAALFVSLLCIGSVHASTAPQVNVYGVDSVTNADGHFEARYHFQRRFAANDPVYPGKVDYITRNVKVEKRGNPMNWVKRTPLEAGTILAVAGAGWAIDELSSQVTRTVQVPATGADAANDGYSWGTSYDQTPNDAFDSFCSSQSLCDHKISIIDYSTTYYKYSFRRTDGQTSSITITRNACPSCVYDPIYVTEYEPVPNSDLWGLVNSVADSSPDHWLFPWARDANGNPYIYPEIQSQQAQIAQGVTGAEPLPDAVVVTDPLAGQGLDPSGVPTGEPVPTPEVNVSVAPGGYPSDYAREDTLMQQKTLIQELRDFFKEEIDQQPDIAKDNPADQIYTPLTDQFDALPDLPTGIPTVGDFGIRSGSCQSINLSWHGHSVKFPSASQCAKLDSAKQILGWFIYVCTFFGCIYIILGARGLKG